MHGLRNCWAGCNACLRSSNSYGSVYSIFCRIFSAFLAPELIYESAKLMLNPVSPCSGCSLLLTRRACAVDSLTLPEMGCQGSRETGQSGLWCHSWCQQWKLTAAAGCQFAHASTKPLPHRANSYLFEPWWCLIQPISIATVHTSPTTQRPSFEDASPHLVVTAVRLSSRREAPQSPWITAAGPGRFDMGFSVDHEAWALQPMSAHRVS